jgi:hypothetical protein
MKPYTRFVSKASEPVEDNERSATAGSDMSGTLSQAAGEIVFRAVADLTAALGQEIREALAAGNATPDRVREAFGACEAKVRLLLKLDEGQKSLRENLSPIPASTPKAPERRLRPLAWSGISGGKAMIGPPIWASRPSPAVKPATVAPKAKVEAVTPSGASIRLGVGDALQLKGTDGQVAGHLVRLGDRIAVYGADGRESGSLSVHQGGVVKGPGGEVLATIQAGR